MNKYRVPVKLIFTGTVDVIAEDDGEAEDICRRILDRPERHKGLSGGISKR